MYNTDFFRLLVDITNYAEFNVTLNSIVGSVLEITFSVFAIIWVFRIFKIVEKCLFDKKLN